MSWEYTLDKVSKLGNYDEKYGQKFWCESPGEKRPLSFNSHENIELTEDSGPLHITAEEQAERKSTKGTVYLQLRKVKVSGSAGQGAHPPVDTMKGSENPQNAAVLQAPVIIEYLSRIEKKVNEIHSQFIGKVESVGYKVDASDETGATNPEEMPY